MAASLICFSAHAQVVTQPPITSPEVYLTKFGANCNGSFDNSIALNKAIAAYPSGGVTFVMPGGPSTCHFNSPVQIQTSNTFLRCQGPNATIMFYTGTALSAGQAFISFASATPASVALSNVGISGCTARSQNSSTDAGTGIQFINADMPWVNDVWVRFFKIGFDVDASGHGIFTGLQYGCNTAFTSTASGSAAFWQHGDVGASYFTVNTNEISDVIFRCGNGFEEAGFKIQDADGFHAISGYVGGFVHNAWLVPGDNASAGVRTVNFTDFRWDYGTNVVDDVLIDTNSNNTAGLMRGIRLEGDHFSNSSQVSGHGLTLNNALASVFVTGGDMTPATAGQVYCQNFSILSIVGTVFTNTPASSAAIQCPATGAFGQLTLDADTFTSTNATITGILAGAPGSGTPSITSSGNSWGVTATPYNVDPSIPLITSGQPLGGGGIVVQATNSTSYYAIGGTQTSTTQGESGAALLAGKAMQAALAGCFVDTAPVGSQTVIFTLRKNNASPSGGSICTITGSGTVGVVSGSLVGFAASDTWDVQIAYSATAVTSKPRFSVLPAY